MRLAIAVLVFTSFAQRAVASPSSGGRERVAIAAFEVSGEPVSPEVQAHMRSELRNGLSAGFDVVPDAEVQKAIESAGVVGCDTLPCLRRIGDLIFAPRVVTAKIQVLGPSNLTTTLELIDLATGRQLAHAEDPCQGCTQKEINDSISNAAASLKTKLDAIETPAAQTLTTTEAPPSYRRNLPLLAAGGITGALGVAGIIVGGVEAGRNQDLCSGAPAGGACVRHRDATSGIIFGFATGVPLLVAGVVMTYFGLRYPARRARAGLAPSPIGPARLSWSF